MTKADILKIANSGDVLAWRHDKSPVNELIAHWTGSTYTHVAVMWWSTPETPMIVQAIQGKGVEAIAFAPEHHPGSCDLISTSAKWASITETLIAATLGRPYSYLAAFEVGCDLTPASNAEICSLYAQQLLESCGIKFSRKGMTPQALVDDLLGLGCVLRNID